MGIKRILGITLSVAVVIGVGWVLWKAGAFASDREPPRPTPTAKATTQDVEESVLATGQVAPVDETEIRSEVSGQVTQVQVHPGQRVQKDDPLMQLDRRELESQVNEDQFQIQADELRAKQARRELERDQDLIGKGFIPQKEYDDAEIALSLAENDLQVQKAKLETLHQQIIKTDLRSPHAGIVLKLDAREGEVIIGASSVSSGTVLMRIADLSRLQVDTRLNEVDVVKVNVNDKVELTFDAVPDKTVTGTVTYISPSADTGDASQGESRSAGGGADSGVRAFAAVIMLDQADSRIRPGITAHIKITMAKAPGAVVVPPTAVFSVEKKNVVYLKKGETFEKRDVEPGISDGSNVEIKKGLAAGDEVALEKPEAEQKTDDAKKAK